ncbi:MAG: tRNA pseudouridine(55) synthase TruB [Candidatus Omnitrophica bacterium]|nr:tRNA pseudouridine(55) synthase TruB [Candidatus Omnitrophota bacterium]
MRNGILVVNKPKGLTSHDVVNSVRRALKMRRVGHAGTLDPLATGVLVILVGKCTKLFNHFLTFDKEYVATLTLGSRTTTGDSDGKIIEQRDYHGVTQDKVVGVLSMFPGELMQVPPMVSAVRHQGQRLYVLARQGKEVVRKPRRVHIKELQLVRFNLPEIQFYLKCSRGTYVRQLAEDIAQELGCIGFVSQIERRGIGPFTLHNAIDLAEVDEAKVMPFAAVMHAQGG